MRSEIGDGALQPAKVSLDEDISITLWQAEGDPPDQVSVVIRPDRTLSVIKYDVDRSQERSEFITHKLDAKHLTQQLSDELRTRLTVYRPEKLAADGPIIFPRGCSFTSHSQGVINIGFMDANERSGYFVLQEGCTGPSAARIEADLKDILYKLPEVDGTRGYGWSGS